MVFAGTVEEFDNYIVPSSIFASLASAPDVEDLKSLPGSDRCGAFGRYQLSYSIYGCERGHFPCRPSQCG